MVKVSHKEEWKEKDVIAGEPVLDDFDTGLDIANHLAVVHSNIKDTVSPDFVMAKFDDKNKEFVIEMVANAYYAKNVLRGLYLEAKRKMILYKQKRPDDKNMIEMLEHKMRMIEKTQKIIFTTYTTKVQMVAIVNRNVHKNYLVKTLAGFQKDEQDGEIVDDGLSDMEKLKGFISDKLGPKNEGV